jgi:VWFA-related protein
MPSCIPATVLVALCAMLGGALPQVSSPAPQAAQAQFRATTTLIPVEVKVVDKNGKPVTDLRESDFTILEDKVPQKIGHFATQTFTPETPPPLGTRPRRAADAFELAGTNQRTFLIALGRGRLEIPAGGITAAIHLVRDRLLPQDVVAIAAWNRSTDFTTDHAAILNLLERFKKGHQGVETDLRLWETSLARIYGDGRFPQGIQKKIDAIFAQEGVGVRTMSAGSVGTKPIADQMRRTGHGALGNQPLDPVDQVAFDAAGLTVDDYLSRTSVMLSDLQTMYAGIDYLRDLAGQRQLVYVSECGITPPRVEDDRMLYRRAADARVALNVIQSGGMCLGLFAAQAMRSFAKGTGGQFYAHRFKNSSGDVDRIDEVSRFQYVLGYYPQREPNDNTYRRIEVKVARKDVTVLVRDGYLARSVIGAEEKRRGFVFGRVTSAAEYVHAITDIGIRVPTATAAGVKPTTLEVSMTIDLSRVAFEKRNGRNVASIEVAAFAVTAPRFFSSNQEDAGHSWQTLELTYTDDRLAEIRRTGLAHAITMPLRGVPRDVKLVIYNYDADVVGSAVVRVQRK